MTKKISVLLIDDDDSFRSVLEKEMIEMNFNTYSAPTRIDALKILNDEAVDIIILDIIMPDINGLDFLPELKESYPEPEVIMLTAHGTIDSAVLALKHGAYDYLTKPCQLTELEEIVKKAYEKKQLVKQNLMFKEQIKREKKYPDIIGKSPVIENLKRTVEKVAATDSTVLIQGKSGVGKEVLARTVYKNSKRKDNPFVIIDCSTLHEDLLESELFGHEKGAYTGAFVLKHGLFEVANGGTIFIDELAETNAAIQAKLLRVIETGSFRRLGGTKDLYADVRLIAATNKSLKDQMEKNLFRDDLYFRLNVMTITIPPLREWKEDIPLLVEHFLKNSKTFGDTGKTISEEAISLLMSYSWPGNVRELENMIERALILADSICIMPNDLPHNIFEDLSGELEFVSGKLLSLKEHEEKYIKKVLIYTENNKLKAAKLLGIDPKTLYRKLKSFEEAL